SAVRAHDAGASAGLGRAGCPRAAVRDDPALPELPARQQPVAAWSLGDPRHHLVRPLALLDQLCCRAGRGADIGRDLRPAALRPRTDRTDAGADAEHTRAIYGRLQSNAWRTSLSTDYTDIIRIEHEELRAAGDPFLSSSVYQSCKNISNEHHL